MSSGTIAIEDLKDLKKVLEVLQNVLQGLKGPRRSLKLLNDPKWSYKVLKGP